MTSIERTAYPRFGRVVTTRAMVELSPIRPSGNNGTESHDKPDSLLRKSPLWLPTWCLTRQYVSNAARSCNPEREVWPVGLSDDPHHVWLAVALRG